MYKLLYASRLADYGLPAQALQYCEQIATVLLGQDMASHPILAQQVMKVSLILPCILGRDPVGSILEVSCGWGCLAALSSPPGFAAWCVLSTVKPMPPCSL